MHLHGSQIDHTTFAQLDECLRPGDVLVLNETRVIPARLRGKRATGGAAEVVLLRPSHGGAYDAAAMRWFALVRPARKLPVGATIAFDERSSARVVAVASEGLCELEFLGEQGVGTLMDRIGRLPLPPYIHTDDAAAQERYQTIFARVLGSVAAPTASLHFTPELFSRLEARGIECVRLSLDVGIGTFRPIKVEHIDAHLMHGERYTIPQTCVERIRAAKQQGRRIIAVGTTAVRALEGNVVAHDSLQSGSFETDVFITPGFSFRVIDALITNFHLPRSSLLVLVAAFMGRERILSAYREAIERGYRFFSFGDAMLLEPEGLGARHAKYHSNNHSREDDVRL